MRALSRIALGGLVAGTATLGYAALVERNWFTLRRIAVAVLHPKSRPIRVLHLSDLHMMPGQRHKQRWVAKLATANPDLVIGTGDFMASPDAVPAVLLALGELLELPGAFVFGSNDYFGPVLKNPFGYFERNRVKRCGTPLPAEELRAALTGAGWADLNNARTRLAVGDQAVDLIGVDDPHIGRDDFGSALTSTQPAETTPAVRIALTHAPEPAVLDAMAADGWNLILSGHTHGGQVRVPLHGALVTNCGLPPAMASGLYPWGDGRTSLHVSAGVGTHPTAPIRFACRPEATLITVVPR